MQHGADGETRDILLVSEHCEVIRLDHLADFFLERHLRDQRLRAGVNVAGKRQGIFRRAETDVLAVLSNCPQINNPCNGFFPTPVQVTIYEPQEG